MDPNCFLPKRLRQCTSTHEVFLASLIRFVKTRSLAHTQSNCIRSLQASWKMSLTSSALSLHFPHESVHSPRSRKIICQVLNTFSFRSYFSGQRSEIALAY